MAGWTAEVAADLGPEYFVPAACRGSGKPAATALPFADGAAGLAWSLGVLCTAPSWDAQLAMLREMRRVVRPGGRIGLLVYLAVTAKLDDPPQGNHFPTSTDLHTLLGRAGLEVLAVADAQDIPEPSASWQERTTAVERELQRRCGQNPQFAAATGHFLPEEAPPLVTAALRSFLA